MKIGDIKKALVEVVEHCKKGNCYACPFRKQSNGVVVCRLANSDDYLPCSWNTDDWKEESTSSEI